MYRTSFSLSQFMQITGTVWTYHGGLIDFVAWMFAIVCVEHWLSLYLYLSLAVGISILIEKGWFDETFVIIFLMGVRDTIWVKLANCLKFELVFPWINILKWVWLIPLNLDIHTQNFVEYKFASFRIQMLIWNPFLFGTELSLCFTSNTDL